MDEEGQNVLLTDLIKSFPISVLDGFVVMNGGGFDFPESGRDTDQLNHYVGECLDRGYIPFWPVRWKYDPSQAVFLPRQALIDAKGLLLFPEGTHADIKRRAVDIFSRGGRPQEVTYQFEGDRVEDTGFERFKYSKLDELEEGGYIVEKGKFMLARDVIDHHGEKGSGRIEDSSLRFYRKDESVEVILGIGNKLSGADKLMVEGWYGRMRESYSGANFSKIFAKEK